MLESNFEYGPPEVWERYTLYPATTETLGLQVSATDGGGGAVVEPVPESVIAAGEFVALLVTVTLPGTSPAPDGAKVTFSVTVCPDVKIRPDETPPTVNPAPETVTFEIVTSEFPPLVKITGRTLFVPILTVEKLKLVLLALRINVGVTGVPGWLGGVLVALVTPVQPEIDRIADSNTAEAAAEPDALPIERALATLFQAPLNPSTMLEILILAIVNCEPRRDYCPNGHL